MVQSLIGNTWERVANCDWWDHERREITRQTGMANARLIAAAPDLLEACREVMQNFLAYKAECNFEGECAGVSMCRAAIAKATEAA